MPCKIILILILSVVSINCRQDTNIRKNVDTVKTKDIEIKNENEEIVSIIGVGDIMMGTNYPSAGSLPPDDGKYLFDDVKEILKNADITCGNLEGTFLDKGGTPKRCNDSGNCHSFRMPTRYAEYLYDAGFDFMNLANNHSGDMGLEGRESTYRTLEKNEISFAGTLDYPAAILEVEGIKYGFAGFAPNNGTVSLINIKKAKEIISDLKAESNIVIVFFHGGAEGNSAQRVSRYNETYLGENRGNVFEFAHAVIDAGADIVFGSGPHVTRAIELYKDRIIAYSLGNFCTYGKFGLSGATGITPIIKIFINKSGEFVRGEITPIKQIKRGFPVIDTDNTAIKTIKSLTKKDFPDTELNISDEGKIEKK
ncbi:MAG: CapA family protein [Ignavibacteria bacterium]|jgi:poly-gamma-glutamate capsule biosynthesis protein CapA/YwtB (metallophosphatase superfamily)